MPTFDKAGEFDRFNGFACFVRNSWTAGFGCHDIFARDDARVIARQKLDIAPAPFEKIVIISESPLQSVMHETFLRDGVDVVSETEISEKDAGILFVMATVDYNPRIIRSIYKKYASRTSDHGFWKPGSGIRSGAFAPVGAVPHSLHCATCCCASRVRLRRSSGSSTRNCARSLRLVASSTDTERRTALKRRQGRLIPLGDPRTMACLRFQLE